MKNLTAYIAEKFQITKDSKLLYKYYPKDKFELREILRERLAKDKDADLNDIDVSQIDDMGLRGFPDDNGLFEDLDPGNIKIDKWDVSNVKNMHNTFIGCTKFNCNLSKWDVSNVQNMVTMFYGCEKFEGKGLENWNPVKCKDMSYMFLGCDSLKNIPSWYEA